jgi:hypothetical protein
MSELTIRLDLNRKHRELLEMTMMMALTRKQLAAEVEGVLLMGINACRVEVPLADLEKKRSP